VDYFDLFFVFFEALILKFQEFIQLPQELCKFPVFLFHGEALAKDMQAFSFIRGHACALFPFWAAHRTPCVQPSVQHHRADPRWSTFSSIPQIGKWKGYFEFVQSLTTYRQ
jgi:hypothetical protein